MNKRDQFFSSGWCSFETDPAVLNWVEFALPAARATLDDPAQQQWTRYQGTWFAGVNALPNDASGRLPQGPPLAGNAIEFIAAELGLPQFGWDKAQVSICYPGYPQPMAGETEGQHNFRKNRDAAHVDGLRGIGQPRRRFLEEGHAFVLGIPMVEASPDASPFVIWEGSHEIMRRTFMSALADIPSTDWIDIDLTDCYQQARKQCFDQCRRVVIHASPGETYLAHRLSLHGVAPWGDTANAGPDGRMICYFRPELPDRAGWLSLP
ncbi:MAG: hypothetical protein AAGA00_03640 [Pseudomonadota bacterium]